MKWVVVSFPPSQSNPLMDDHVQWMDEESSCTSWTPYDEYPCKMDRTGQPNCNKTQDGGAGSGYVTIHKFSESHDRGFFVIHANEGLSGSSALDKRVISSIKYTRQLQREKSESSHERTPKSFKTRRDHGGTEDDEVAEEHQHMTPKLDVYSFGVLLLRLFCRGFQDERELLQWARPLLARHAFHELLDGRLEGCDTYELYRVMLTAAACISLPPLGRPTITQVVSMLESRNSSILTPSPSSSCQSPAKGLGASRDTFLHGLIVYNLFVCMPFFFDVEDFPDCHPDSAKNQGSAAGGLFWQLVSDGMEISDGYEII
ncbi:hypothetical protein AMTR_s00003p00123920 [Amborella trichopoda]|uniref:Serine-threonine/tyrosine-protein kinase catalytic domain-containing protein n=1 Tax=Amborella trichopoda TaxID=13333 RepID=W1P6A1_AMBTC|nr:hypothetical protein AMTR_s00003p00123920 [Amborella trichopoda]